MPPRTTKDGTLVHSFVAGHPLRFDPLGRLGFDRSRTSGTQRDPPLRKNRSRRTRLTFVKTSASHYLLRAAQIKHLLYLAQWPRAEDGPRPSKEASATGTQTAQLEQRTRACVDESQHPGSKNLHNIWLVLELTRVAGTPHPRTFNLCGLRNAVRTDTARLTPSTERNPRERDARLFVRAPANATFSRCACDGDSRGPESSQKFSDPASV